jgi:hypothetical protein
LFEGNEVTIAFGAAVHWALETLEKIQIFQQTHRFKNFTTPLTPIIF